ncbi:hypothetical protein [Rosenbergiella gaditana]|uniref:hypothetical protein n=1 Tax=Rosenbergiella gaditana TaxID=2726987 RepID=UPI002024B92E|nr:hypothetical protein [Rosenbergiella gaditana]
MILWNQIPSNGQQIPSISETSKFGVDPSVILNPLQEGSIPGYATYFWFLTDRNLLATVKLHNKLTSQGSLQHYIHCFLKGSSEHVVAKAVTKEDGKVEVCISGYKKDVADEHEVQKHYNPGFTTSLVRNRGKHDIIRQNANNIKKIERVIELDVSKPEQLGLWQKMLQFSRLGGNNSQYADTSTKVRYTLSPHVTLEDLNAMIDDWESDPNEVNDYGFYLGGESNRPYWLSKSLARTEFGLNIERENVEFVQLNSLLNSLVSKKVEILKGAGII